MRDIHESKGGIYTHGGYGLTPVMRGQKNQSRQRARSANSANSPITTPATKPRSSGCKCIGIQTVYNIAAILSSQRESRSCTLLVPIALFIINCHTCMATIPTLYIILLLQPIHGLPQATCNRLIKVQSATGCPAAAIGCLN